MLCLCKRYFPNCGVIFKHIQLIYDIMAAPPALCTFLPLFLSLSFNLSFQPASLLPPLFVIAASSRGCVCLSSADDQLCSACAHQGHHAPLHTPLIGGWKKGRMDGWMEAGSLAPEALSEVKRLGTRAGMGLASC